MGKEIFKPVRNKSLSKMVMESIKEVLIQKTLKPGDRLPTETELCESLGVGKSSVREAIKMLEVLGVVETRQGEGTYIAKKIAETSVNPLVYQLLIDDGSVSECGGKRLCAAGANRGWLGRIQHGCAGRRESNANARSADAGNLVSVYAG